MKRKITSRLLESVQPPARGELKVFDTEVTGFHVRAYASGRITYNFRYRLRGAGKWWPIRIGSFPTLKVAQARKIAGAHAAAVAAGQHPAEKKDTADVPGFTVTDLYASYIQHSEEHNRQGTTENYRSLWARHIKPALGGMLIQDVSQDDCEILHNAMHSTPANGNNVLRFLSVMFSNPIARKLRRGLPNPCAGIKRHTLRNRKRYLDAEEVRRLGAVIDRFFDLTWEHQRIAVLADLLLFTGARCKEIMHAKWEWLDWQNNRLLLPYNEHKTGDHEGDKEILIPAPAMLRLQEWHKRVQEHLSCDHPEWIIPGNASRRPLSNPRHHWNHMRKEAGLDGVILHDLRRTFASAAMGNGEGLAMIGKMLGHSNTQTTGRYAFMATAPKQEAVRGTAATLTAWKKGEAQNANVVSLRPTQDDLLALMELADKHGLTISPKANQQAREA